MLGMGLNADGHKRVTTGDNFVLLGGSEKTHERMVEKAIQINEKLAHKGKQLGFVGVVLTNSVGIVKPVFAVKWIHNTSFLLICVFISVISGHSKPKCRQNANISYPFAKANRKETGRLSQQKSIFKL